MTPGPANYDTRREFDLRKDFTMGSRYYNLENDEMDYPPSDKVIIRSDFDEISNNPHFAFQNATRFKMQKIEPLNYPEKICEEIFFVIFFLYYFS